MLSSARCRFQNSPFRSWSLSSALGRWRWVRFLPNRQASKTTPAKGESVEAPSGVITSARANVRSGLLLLKASSFAGRLVKILQHRSVSIKGRSENGRGLLHLAHQSSSASQYRCWHNDLDRKPSKTSSFSLLVLSSLAVVAGTVLRPGQRHLVGGGPSSDIAALPGHNSSMHVGNTSS